MLTTVNSIAHDPKLYCFLLYDDHQGCDCCHQKHGRHGCFHWQHYSQDLGRCWWWTARLWQGWICLLTHRVDTNRDLPVHPTFDVSSVNIQWLMKVQPSSRLSMLSGNYLISPVKNGNFKLCSELGCGLQTMVSLKHNRNWVEYTKLTTKYW